MKKPGKYWMTIIIMAGLTLLMGTLCLFPGVCDWYTDHIFSALADVISPLTGAIPFALGEILMYVAALLLVIAFVVLILLSIFRKKTAYRAFCSGYYKSLLAILVGVCLVYMLLWFIPFCGTTLGQGDPQLRTDYSYEEISALYAYIVEGANAAAEEIEIAEDGTVPFPTKEEYEVKNREAMLALGSEFPRLLGHYPPVKEALCSDILERMNIGGYNYPYTMEPTCNRYLTPTYQPVLMSHEMCHHHGYFKEHEANFLSELALSRSEDPYLRFSAFLNMSSYVFEDYYEAQDMVLDEMVAAGQVDMPESLSSPEDVQKFVQVIQDVFGEIPELSERAYAIIDAGYKVEEEIYREDEHPIDELPEIDNAIQDVADQGWKIQGEILREKSYDGVVLLLLQYFDGKLY